MSKDIEIRIIVPQKHTQEEFDAILNFDSMHNRNTRVWAFGDLMDVDSFYYDEDYNKDFDDDFDYLPAD